MPKSILTLALVLMLSFSLFGRDDLVQLRFEHESFGSVEPIISPWYSDQVSWTSVANAGIPFGRAGSGVLGDYFYVFGSMYASRGQAFNWMTEHWQLSTPPPLGNCNWCAVATSDAIYLIGMYWDYNFGTEVQKFTPIDNGPTGVWTTVADYPLAIAGIAAAWDGGNFIYAAGGSNFSNIFPNAYKYDITEDCWTAIAPLPLAMTYHGGAFVDGEFHVMGGVQEPASAHYAYDTSTDSWSAKTPMPIPNYFATFSLTFSENCIISVGGGGGYYNWPATNAVQIYYPSTDSWTQETPLPTEHGLNSAQYAPGGIVINAGGYTGTYLADTHKGNGFPDGSPPGSGLNDETIASTSAGFKLHPAYPNPFNPEINLRFTLPKAGEVLLIIFDLKGQEVARLIDGLQPAGVHEATFFASDLSTGIYFAHLTCGDLHQTRKLIFIK